MIDVFEAVTARVELCQIEGARCDALEALRSSERVRHRVRWEDTTLSIEVWMAEYSPSAATGVCAQLIHYLIYSSGSLVETTLNDERETRAELVTWMESGQGFRARIHITRDDSMDHAATRTDSDAAVPDAAPPDVAVRFRAQLVRLTARLAALPRECAVDVVSTAFARLNARAQRDEAGELERDRLFVGLATANRDDAAEWQPWELAAVPRDVSGGLPVTSEPFHDLCQASVCPGCGTQLYSQRKHGICPICDRVVYLT